MAFLSKSKLNPLRNKNHLDPLNSQLLSLRIFFSSALILHKNTVKMSTNIAGDSTENPQSVTRVSTDIDSVNGDGEFPTHEELHSLRRVADKIPWRIYTIAFVELVERFSYYGTTVVCMLLSPHCYSNLN